MTHQQNLSAKKKSRKRGGDALVGIGSILAIIGFLLALINMGSAAGTGANIMMGMVLVVSGLLMVVIGYLKRIAIALESH